MFPLDKIESIKKNPENYKLQERIPLPHDNPELYPMELRPKVGDEVKLLILDTETMGLDYNTDAIIELGLVVISYSPSTFEVTSIDGVLSLYEDPLKPIPELITELTGITDEMVSGESFDESEVESWFDGIDLVVAHHAQFDRPFVEKRFPNLAGKPWACTIQDIDWKKAGHTSVKLEYLLAAQSYFYEGHRASIDCLAVAWLLYLVPQALCALIFNAEANSVIVRAYGAPFKVKDDLKKRDYMWNDGSGSLPKHWYKSVKESELENEKQEMLKIYQYQGQTRYEVKTARDRYLP